MRTSNEASGLAGALRHLGQGSQPYLGGLLGALRVPLTAVAGSADERYVGHARTMAGAVAGGRFVEVRGAGHAVVGEDPGAVAEAVSG
jgi:pimeloyl-ACP methyl ester carboxylesterase